MGATLRKPEVRRCERCGRVEAWDDGAWQIAVEDGEKQIGDAYCIHEWDITGTFTPVEEG